MTSSNKTQIIIAGHGGQGVLELANYLSYYEVLKGKHVAQTPSYGPETRGGKVKCYVVVSEDEIDSPLVEEADHIIVMNSQSMEYAHLLRKGGILLANSSLVSEQPSRNDIVTYRVPATSIAEGLKSSIAENIHDTKIAANAVILGSYLSMTNEVFTLPLIRDVFAHFLLDKKAVYIELDLLAVQKGYEYFDTQGRQSVPTNSVLAV